jgi:hypothetical protein
MTRTVRRMPVLFPVPPVHDSSESPVRPNP